LARHQRRMRGSAADSGHDSRREREAGDVGRAGIGTNENDRVATRGQALCLESRASSALIATTVIICVVGMTLPFTAVGDALGFTPLPWLYWPLLIAILLSYTTLAHLLKVWFVHRWGM
jgi:hypothetical protein